MKRWLILKRHRVRSPRLVIKEAKRANLALSNALAMLEKETGIPQRNVFGCDWGPQGGRPPYCGDAVTKARVDALRRSGRANGVGWTQLTWPPYVTEAERHGGAHLPRNQMRVGFKVLAGEIRNRGTVQGFAAYNGSGPAAQAYGREAAAIAQKWHQRLN